MGCRFEMISRYKLKIAHFLSGELLQKAGDVNTAKEHMQRTINSLEGPGKSNFKARKNLGHPLHGMPGGSIIDDLGDRKAAEAFGPEAARAAHEMARSARDAAVQSIANPNVTLGEIKKSGRAVSTLLQSAIDRLGP